MKPLVSEHFFRLFVICVLACTPVAVAAEQAAAPPTTAAGGQAPDPRAGDPDFERARSLLSSIDEILKDTADIRHDARKLPSANDYTIITPPWIETREDRQKKVDRLLDQALAVVTDVPVVELQKQMSERRQTIKKLEDDIAVLREKQLDAPKSGLLPGYVTDTVGSIDEEIIDLNKRIDLNKTEISSIKNRIAAALRKNGVEIGEEQLDILLGSVIGGDIVRLVAAFNAARSVDQRLADLMNQNGDNLTAARRYFAMHASLFALLAHAQELLLDKIDTLYLPRLAAIVKDLREARKETYQLLRENNRNDQRQTLLNNLKAQMFSEKVAKTYRSYLLTQRDQLIETRRRTLRDLRIADNTYTTVEASFQLRNLIKDSNTSFDAIRKLEMPGFDNVFRNKELQREFENLTNKLAPTS